MNMTKTRWGKSRCSNINGNCVELTTTHDELRDSKDPQGPALKVDVVRFVRAVKPGRFDR